MTAPDNSSSRDNIPTASQIHEAASSIETLFRSLLKGRHSSATLSFNEQSASNYTSVADHEAEEGQDLSDWVSIAEKERGCFTNSKWTLQWYPDTPIGFHSLSASSLPTLLAAVAMSVSQQGDES